MCVGHKAGLVEYITDARSVDDIKKYTPGYMGMRVSTYSPTEIDNLSHWLRASTMHVPLAMPASERHNRPLCGRRQEVHSQLQGLEGELDMSV